MEKQAVARMSVHTLLDQLQSSAQGLAPADIAQRRLQYGLNALTPERTRLP